MTQIQTKQKEAKRIFLKKLGIETDLEGRVILWGSELE